MAACVWTLEMARRVFFSFHFADIWQVNQIRNANVIPGPDRAGFYDHSEYLEAKKKGDDHVKRLLRRKLEGTSVTVVLIGHKTASRRYVKYEIGQSLKRNNGLLGIFVHAMKVPGLRRVFLLSDMTDTFFLPAVPAVPAGTVFPTYTWDDDRDRFAAAIEEAGRRADALRDARGSS